MDSPKAAVKMPRPSVAFIVCDSGMGHTRRSFIVARAFKRRSPEVDVVLYANPERARLVGDLFIPFETHSLASGFRSGDPRTCRWDEQLPDLSAFDLVVSDNLVEVLSVRRDAILMGSFLWHDALPDGDPHWITRAQNLVSSCRPRMLGTSSLSTHSLMSRVQFDDIGFVVADDHPRFSLKQNSNDLLISCGRTGECRDGARELIDVIKKRGIPKEFKAIHVEPDLCPAFDGMQRATFDSQMYSQIIAAVIRPGAGTVTDALCAGARVFGFYESGNVEMTDNVCALETLGVGAGYKSATDAYAAAIEFVRDQSAIADHRTKIQKLHEKGLFDGAKQASRILSECLYDKR